MIFPIQYLASDPLNPSGFKIGLELLLKTPLKPNQLVHVPYGFSKRLVGSSKLGMKVIIKYVGQLLALYQWSFGIFFFFFVGSATAATVYLATIVAGSLVEVIGWQNSRLGRTMTWDKKKKKRQRSDV